MESATLTAAHCRQVFALVVFTLATGLGASAAVMAQDDATRTLTVLALRCPDGYAGEIPADDCNTPVGDVIFRVGRPLTDFIIRESTDAAGAVQFEFAGLPLRGTISLIEELPAPTERFAVDCIDEVGAPLALIYEDILENVPPIGVAKVTFGDVGDVHCTWYNILEVP